MDRKAPNSETGVAMADKINIDQRITELIREEPHFGIKWTLDRSLEDDEPSRFLLMFNGTVFWSNVGQTPDIPEEIEVGSIEVIRVQRLRAELAGQSLFEVCDCYSQAIYDVYSDLFEEPECEWNAAAEQLIKDSTANDLLIIQNLTVYSPLIAEDLGHRLVIEIAKTFSDDCALIAMVPWPLRPNPKGLEVATEVELLQARVYWSRIGFERVADSHCWAVNPEVLISR